MRRSIALAVLALLAVPAGASAATLGEQRVLMMLTTWGPEPYAPATIRAELDEAAAYMRSVSFGKTWIASLARLGQALLRSRAMPLAA